MKNKIKSKYSELSPENRVHFWSITASSIVAVLTFGMGMLIQYTINQNYAKETSRLARYQMVQEVYPLFDGFVDSCGLVYFDLMRINQYENSDAASRDSIFLRLYAKRNDLDEQSFKIVNFLNKSHFYFNIEVQEQLNLDDLLIQMNQRLLENKGKKLYALLSDSNYRNAGSLAQAMLSFGDSISMIDVFASYDEDQFQIVCQSFSADIVRAIPPGHIPISKSDTMYCEGCALYYLLYKPISHVVSSFYNELQPIESHWYENTFVRALLWFVVAILLGLAAVFVLLTRVFNSQNADPSQSTDSYAQLEQRYKILSEEVSSLKAIIKLQSMNEDRTDKNENDFLSEQEM